MPAEALEWHTEYLYRKTFALTHEQYLDEPGEAIEWLTRIHGLYEAREERQRAAGG